LWSIFFPVSLPDQDRLAGELWQRGTAGIIEETDGLRAFFDENTDPDSISALGENSGPQIEANELPAPEELDSDPILVGERFFIVPTGSLLPTPPLRLRLEVDAAAAFGSGRHETTQLCLQAVERYFLPNELVLDVGCGSGILTRAAVLLYTLHTVSCDIDENAVLAAERRLKTPLFVGSVDAIADGCAGFVLANLTASVLDTLAFDLRRVLKPNGLLVISGFVSQNPPRGFAPQTVLEQGDWLCWICRPAEITPLSKPSPEGLSHKAEWWL
jgi:Ribosomal protein L11 methyltransferase (PrmA)